MADEGEGSEGKEKERVKERRESEQMKTELVGSVSVRRLHPFCGGM